MLMLPPFMEEKIALLSRLGDPNLATNIRGPAYPRSSLSRTGTSSS